jgi:hypothetical protein
MTDTILVEKFIVNRTRAQAATTVGETAGIDITMYYANGMFIMNKGYAQRYGTYPEAANIINSLVLEDNAVYQVEKVFVKH